MKSTTRSLGLGILQRAQQGSLLNLLPDGIYLVEEDGITFISEENNIDNLITEEA